VNHNGSLEMAERLVDAAAEAGADAVKFQTFRAEGVASAAAGKAAYQVATTGKGGSQLAMLRALELDETAHAALMKRCKAKRVEFLSTPFDLASVDLLARLGVRGLKISSGDITNAGLLLRCARTGLPILLSTGMSTLKDVEAALGVLAFGYTRGRDPGKQAFRRAYAASRGRAALRARVTLLHCTSEYPAPLEDTNLRAMITMRETFGLPVGFSDHTPGITAAIAAVALGAVVIEKHFTLDRSLPGPDHRASLEPGELRALVTGVHDAFTALGSRDKKVAPSEARNRDVARKSLVAARRIAKGEAFSEMNLTVKRPGSGVSPFAYWERLGRKAPKDFEADEVIAS
jgi:N-acetylneuraminate synthase